MRLRYMTNVSDGTTATPGGVVPTGDPLGGKGAFGIRTGLLPAFAVFDAKGKEGETDLSVHFGFRAPDPVRIRHRFQ